MAFVGEALLSASFQTIINELVSPVIKEFTTRSGMDKDLRKLRRMLPKIQAVLDDAEQKETSDPLVKEWLKDLTDIAYDIQDIMEELAYEVELFKMEGETETATNQVRKFFSPDCSLSEKVDGVMKRFEEIEEDRKSLRLSEIVGPRRLGKTQRLQTTSVIGESNFIVGRENDTNKIIELLLKPGRNNVSVISIVGMGGLGKTTLAQHVFDHKSVNEHFEIKAWACVSDEFDVKRLTQAILELVTDTTPDFKELTKLQVTLKDKLKEKRFLLILDDVWSENREEWDLLRAPLGVGASGSKILITTRSKQVALITGGADNVHHLGVLSYEHCYSLFMHCAFPEGNSYEYPRLEVIGKEIVNECDGLPLAAKTLGRLLYSQVDEEKWKHVLQSEMWDLQDGSRYILPALRLSYHHLPSHLKQCFAYCSIFPKDYMFEKMKLVQLWMAQGYVQSKGTKGLEDIGSEYFDDLFSRCFFQHREGDYVMHDLVHDLAQYVSGELYCRMGEHLSRNISERTRHWSIFRPIKQKPPHDLETLYKAKSLRTVLSSRTKLPHDFWHKQRYLRVLDLSRTGTDEIPDSVSNLRQLRYLDLSSTQIKMLPESIGRLFNLQTLKLGSCEKFKELPNSIGNLKLLRHLKLSYTSISMLPESLGHLTDLRKLLVHNCGLEKLPYSIGNLKHLQYIDMSCNPIQMLPDSIDGLSNLQELILRECDQLRELPKYIGNLISLRSFDNEGCVSIPVGIGKLTSLHQLPLFILSGESGAKLGDLKELNQLQGRLHISGLENVINADEAKAAALKDKQYLQCLTLKWGDSNGNLRHQSVEELVLGNLQPPTNLEVLKIEGFNCGSRFPNWMVDPSFSKLWSITLGGNGECCKVLPPLGKLQFLKALYISQIGGLQHMECEFCGDVKGFPSLETLHVEDLPDLEELFCGEDEYEFRCLSDLTIINCQKLRKLAYTFPVLKRLEIQSRDGLVVLPTQRASSSSSSSLQETSRGFLSTTLQLLDISDCSKSLSLQAFTSLETLQIFSCPNLVSFSEVWLPTTLKRLEIYVSNLESLSLQAITSLETLDIGWCPKLVSFSEVWLPTTLKSLSISHCPIKDLLNGLNDLTSIESLSISSCDELESLPENGLPNSLRSFQIYNCKLLDTRCKEGGEDRPKIAHISNIFIYE